MAKTVKAKSAVKATAFTLPLTSFQHLISVLKGQTSASLRETGTAVLDILRWAIDIATPVAGTEEGSEIFALQVKAKGAKTPAVKMTKAKLIKSLEAIVATPADVPQVKGVGSYLWLVPILLDVLEKLRAGKKV